MDARPLPTGRPDPALARVRSGALYRRSCPTPIGELTLVGSNEELRRVLWEEDPLPAGVATTRCPLLEDAARQLDAYFAGDLRDFDIALDLAGTAFQLAAWRALAALPYGATSTYGEQARRLGRPAAARAVGAANGRNPVPIVLPCHRLVGSDGSLVGFGGGLDRKAWLLAHEAAVLG